MKNMSGKGYILSCSTERAVLSMFRGSRDYTHSLFLLQKQGITPGPEQFEVVFYMLSTINRLLKVLPGDIRKLSFKVDSPSARIVESKTSQKAAVFSFRRLVRQLDDMEKAFMAKTQCTRTAEEILASLSLKEKTDLIQYVMEPGRFVVKTNTAGGRCRILDETGSFINKSARDYAAEKAKEKGCGLVVLYKKKSPMHGRVWGYAAFRNALR